LKIPELKLGQVVAILWADSKSALGWQYDPKKKRTPGYIASIGYVVQSNDECVTITTSMDSRGASIDDFSIPCGCVQKLEVLDKRCELMKEA
jgi:hypothetical protein